MTAVLPVVLGMPSPAASQFDNDPIPFGPFRLDRDNARLLNGDRPVALTPKLEAEKVPINQPQRDNRERTACEQRDQNWPA